MMAKLATCMKRQYLPTCLPRQNIQRSSGFHHTYHVASFRLASHVANWTTFIVFFSCPHLPLPAHVHSKSDFRSSDVISTSQRKNLKILFSHHLTLQIPMGE